MNSKLIVLLIKFCFACVIIIGIEWGYAFWSHNATLISLKSTEIKNSQDEMPHIDLQKKTEESYADLVARPLFIKGRRPVEEPSPEEVQNSAAPVVFDWQLNGVYSTKKGLSAFLCRTTATNSKDKYKKVSKDDELDGWKLSEITPDKVIFTQGDQEKELLLRKIKPKDPSKKTNAQIVPNNPSPEDSQAVEEAEPESTNE